MASVETSPFVFDAPVGPADLIGRDHELAVLRNRAAFGRFVLLTAPRRFGKTSLLRSLAAGPDADLAVVIVDLFAVLTMDDLARRFAAAFRSLPGQSGLLQKLQRAVGGLTTVGLTGPGAGITVAKGSTPPSPASFEEVLDLPAEAARQSGVRLLVVLDEFQAIADVPRAEGVLRSRIQHQRDWVSYVFSGSEQGTLAAIFADQARPLFGQAERLRLGSLPLPALSDFIAQRFEETGRDPGTALGPLVRTCGGHPQRSMLAAHHLWQLTPTGEAADRAAWAEAQDTVIDVVRDELVAIHGSLSAGQRKVLRLLAFGEPLHGAAGGRLGLHPGSATQARHALVRRSLVTEDGPDDPAAIVDPFLGVWIRANQTSP